MSERFVEEVNRRVVAEARAPIRRRWNSNTRDDARRRAANAARLAEHIAKLFILLGVVGGIALAAIRDQACQGGGCNLTDEQPFLVTGVMVACLAVFQGVFVLMIAAYIQSCTLEAPTVPTRSASSM